MQAARRVLERLERIDSLLSAGAGRQEMLDELRALVSEGEAWARAEGDGTDRARSLLADIDGALEGIGEGRAHEGAEARRAAAWTP